MAPLTLIYTYYRNPLMLKKHLGVWNKYPPDVKENLRVILVDDGSPADPAIEHVRGVGIDLALYRILVNIPWNQDGARNLAMRECETEWALMSDIDHLLPWKQARRAIAMAKLPGVYYRPGQRRPDGEDRGRPHPNIFLLRRDDFWAMGGYDEDFAGYWGSDKNFVKCLAAVVKPKRTNAFYLVSYRESEIRDSKTRDFGRRGGRFHMSAKNEAMMAEKPWLVEKHRGPAYKAENPIRFPWERVI